MSIATVRATTTIISTPFINNLSFSPIVSHLVLFHIHFTQEIKTLFSAISVTVCLGLYESSVKNRVTIEQMSKEMSILIFLRLMQLVDVTVKSLILGLKMTQ